MTKKGSVDVAKLNDPEVLDLRKQEESIHTVPRELIDKVSFCEKFVLLCGDAAQVIRSN